MTFKELKALLRRRFTLPKERPVRRAIRSFSLAERTVFYTLVTLFVLSGLTLLWNASEAFLVEVPSHGGTITEGVVGNPRFINPVLALSEADKNLTSLVYSGLVRITPEGEIENDLASSIDLSLDALTYTAKLDERARFHDGMPVSADDIIFTVQKMLDPLLKSPRRGNWEGVAVSKIDERTVSFTLKKAYAPFIYNLTTGILPKHIWKNVTPDEFSFSQFNTLPVGSGPFKVNTVKRNEGGIPDYYELTPFKDSDTDAPYIGKLIMKFYPSEASLIDAYDHGDIQSVSGVTPERLAELDMRGSAVMRSPLPRIFAVFFNQSQSRVLHDKAVREALDLTAPRQKIVTEVFDGYATAINTPFPAGIYSWAAAEEPKQTDETYIEMAKDVLRDGGWKPDAEGLLEKKAGSDTMKLSFSISTGDAPELRRVADLLVSTWEKLGARIEVLTFETGELNQSVIRPRHFDALLFGEMVGRDADVYPFWHSSQRNDPGLNIALYANSKADKFLEKARVARDGKEAEGSYHSFAEEVSKDIPAVFLYTPSFLYVLPEKVKAAHVGSLATAQDRFSGIRDWYVETDKVWRIFLEN